MTARGIRDHNPGNLRPVSPPWRGQVGEEGGYAVFDSDEHGVRACTLNLVNAQRLHGCRTIRSLITRYAPPEENDTEAYIAAVAAGVGIDEVATMDLTDFSVLWTLVRAIIKHENGVDPVDLYGSANLDAWIREGWS